MKTGLLRDIKTKSDELRKETVTVDKHKLMLQNLIKLDRGELPPNDENFAAATEIAKTHGAKAMDHVTEEVETAQKRVDAARNAVIKMRSQLQAIATLTSLIFCCPNRNSLYCLLGKSLLSTETR